MVRIGVQSWSLNRVLGPLRWTRWDSGSGITTAEEPRPLAYTLQELPSELKQRGFGGVELCHFYLESTDPGYLQSIREAYEKAGVEISSLLLDYGDIASGNPERGRADLAWARQWIDIAASIGARRARVIAGESPPTDRAALQRSIAGLQELADHAAASGVRLLTENFKPLGSTASNLLEIVEALDGKIGLTVDFGNIGPDAVDDLRRIMPFAETLHAKPPKGENGSDRQAFERYLELAREAGFNGWYSIVFEEESQDPWEGIAAIGAIIRRYA